MSGSTKLYVAVGDDRAREIVARTLDLWSALTVDGGGQVIQLRGDGMLCMFPTIDSALISAVSMRDLPYEEPLSMHAGLHVGVVLRETEQLYGDVVNVAARMADIAKRFEIVMTAAAQAQLTETARWRNLRLIRKVPVKGKSEPMDIYLLANDKQALTDYRPAAANEDDRRAARAALRLRRVDRRPAILGLPDRARRRLSAQGRSPARVAAARVGRVRGGQVLPAGPQHERHLHRRRQAARRRSCSASSISSRARA